MAFDNIIVVTGNKIGDPWSVSPPRASNDRSKARPSGEIHASEQILTGINPKTVIADHNRVIDDPPVDAGESEALQCWRTSR